MYRSGYDKLLQCFGDVEDFVLWNVGFGFAGYHDGASARYPNGGGYNSGWGCYLLAGVGISSWTGIAGDGGYVAFFYGYCQGTSQGTADTD